MYLFQLDDEIKLVKKRAIERALKRKQDRSSFGKVVSGRNPDGDGGGFGKFRLHTILIVAAPVVIGAFIWRYFYHLNHP